MWPKLKRSGSYANLSRWYDFVSSLPAVQAVQKQHATKAGPGGKVGATSASTSRGVDLKEGKNGAQGKGQVGDTKGKGKNEKGNSWSW